MQDNNSYGSHNYWNSSSKVVAYNGHCNLNMIASVIRLVFIWNAIVIFQPSYFGRGGVGGDT